MGLKVGEVKLEKYNYNWKNMFEEEKENLKNIFGNIAVTIEHVGSTSVEGLSAKPIIDILVGINDFKDFYLVKEHFDIPPYSIKTDSDDDEILVRKGDESNRTHFIHIMEIGSTRYINQLRFRDYLLTHKDTVKEYEDLKIMLAERFANDRKLYTASKNDFIQSIIKKSYIEDLSFKKYDESNYDFVYELKKIVYKKYVEEYFKIWDEDAQKNYFKSFIEKVYDNTYIIQLNGKDIGFYNLEYKDDYVEIGNICILPKFQNYGIGTFILNKIISENSDKKIKLQYFKSNPVGELYSKLGFKKIGESDFHFHMEK